MNLRHVRLQPFGHHQFLDFFLCVCMTVCGRVWCERETGDVQESRSHCVQCKHDATLALPMCVAVDVPHCQGKSTLLVSTQTTEMVFCVVGMERVCVHFKRSDS